MTSPTPRSVLVRLSMDTSSYIAGASRAEAATASLDKAVKRVGPSTAASLDQAAKGAGTAEGALGKLNKAAGGLGVTLGGLAGVGGALAVGMSVKWAGDYQSALTRLATTAGESPAKLKMVGQGLLDMAGQVGIAADELAKGAYTVESGGFHGADALTVMKAAAEGARQENADLGKVTDAVTTILHDYHLQAGQAATVTSQLVTAVSHGKTNFDELTGSLHSVTPLAAKMGISIADVTGTLAAMTASGESADQATQNMANTLQHLASPTLTMIAELGQLGISTDDLATSLSTRGLAGTLQMVEEAIVRHVDPATQRVLLPAFNQSKSAAQDLQIMIGKMPPALAKLSQALLTGSETQKDYRKAAQEMGGQAGVLGDQFLTLYKSSDGFNSVLKQGGPAAQVFTAAMSKAFGTTAALNVALQTTGENTASTNAAIKDIAGATAQADGNIKGWSEVQGNFNQQLAQFEAHAKSLAIEAGQHLLPILTDTFHWVDTTAIPGLEHLGSAAGGAWHEFSQLPGPIKDTAYALAALRVADAVGVFDRLSSGAGRVGSSFSNLRQEIGGMQIWQSLQAGAGGAEASVGRVSAAASVLGSRARDAGNALMGAFGGPWVLTTAAVAGGIYGIVKAFQAEGDEIRANTAQLLAWMKQQDQGGAAAQQAGAKIGQYEAKIANLRTSIQNMQHVVADPNSTMGLGRFGNQLEVNAKGAQDLQTALDRAKQQYKDYLATLSPLALAQARVAQAQNDLNNAEQHNPPYSAAVQAAAERYQVAQHNLSLATDGANQAVKTQIQRMQDQASAMLGVVDAQRSAQEAQFSLTQQIQQYNSDVTAGAVSAAQLKQEQLNVADAAEQAAKAAGDAAAATAKQNGATDTTTASQAAFIKSLQDTANQLTGPARQAVLDMITAMGGQETQAQLTAGAVNQLGVTVTDLPNSHMITIDVPTDDQMKKLHDLGYATVTLPNGKVVISADTNPAIGEIQDLLNYARQQSINFRANLAISQPLPGTSQRMGTYATGGQILGAGTQTSDSIPIMASNREWVIQASSSDMYGPATMASVNAGTAMIIPGFAGGGWVNVPAGGFYAGSWSVPVTLDPGTYKSDLASYLGSLSSPYAGMVLGATSQQAVQMGARMAAARGWNGPQFMDLFNLWMRESGWNPYAVNPSSGAYGIPQSLGHGHPFNLGDIAAQETWGMDYIAQRYGTPAAAWAHELAFGWYHDGGTVQGPDGATVPAFLKVGETVRTAEQERAVERVLRSREFGGIGAGPMVVHQTTNRNYTNNVSAGPQADEIARAVTRAQYVQDFLHG